MPEQEVTTITLPDPFDLTGKFCVRLQPCGNAYAVCGKPATQVRSWAPGRLSWYCEEHAPAVHAPKDEQAERIAALEAENARLKEQLQHARTIYAICPYQHESWPSYVCTTLERAAAYLSAQGAGLYAINEWTLDTERGVPSRLGTVYDAETMQMVEDPDA